jgi:hypothetical protein
MGDKAAQFQFLITVEGWDGYFVSRTGGDNQANIQAVYDGGSLVPDLVAGRPRPTNVVVTRVWDPERDGPIHHDYGNRVGRWTTNITIQPTDADLTPVGEARTYPGAKLARMGEPPADAQSDDPSRWEAEFAVAQMA